MEWVLLGCAGVLLALAALCGWSAWVVGRGKQAPAASRVWFPRQFTGPGANAAALWWSCADLTLFGVGAIFFSLTEFPRFEEHGWLDGLGALFFLSGLAAGFVAYRKRPQDRVS
ncbi:hypothetical protein [Cryptosporangium aurantiacum]|uniref:Uncharacterized protein n=1 Tax=Cryptosporangium aurantiacum TaxID=134849 RepID=A0A1M7RBF2_9ACTN|nr:hypothetical protein [Cryptosporangium aurantiacum]SHN43593.1 hypothetical protein SAMN05443668_109252 [Cryptosporangium aurantiacum]